MGSWNICRGRALGIALGITVLLIVLIAGGAGAEQGLVAEYHFDGDTLDSSGNGNHGTNYGATFVRGVNGQTLSFDGVDDYVGLGSWFDYQTFTISMWVNPGANQVDYANIIDNNHQYGLSWELQQNSNNLNRYFWGPADGYCGSDPWSGDDCINFNLHANEWTQIVLTRDGSTRINAVYINGALLSSVVGPGDIPYDGTQFVRLGKWGDGGRNWNGKIDEVRIYNRVLSAEEIKILFEGEHPLVAIGELTETGSARKLARTSDGVLHTVYYRSDGYHSQIYHASSSDNGRTWKEEALTSESYDQSYPAIAADSNDYLHVVWQGSHSGSPSHTQIRYKKYTPTGWGDITNITNDTDWYQRTPAIAVDGNDNLHVVWQKLDFIGGAWCSGVRPEDNSIGCGPIYYSKYTSSTNSWSALERIGEADQYHEIVPSIAIDSNDYLHVAWSTGGYQNAACWHSAYRRFTTSWQPVESFECYDTFPSIAADSQGNVHYVSDYGAYQSFIRHCQQKAVLP